MSSRLKCLTLGVLLALLPLQAGAAVLDHVTFTAGGEALEPDDQKPVELQIDSRLQIDVDEPGLLQEVASVSGVEPDLTQRVEKLKVIIQQFFLAQQRLIELRNALTQLGLARAQQKQGKISADVVNSLVKKRDDASEAFAQAASPALDAVLPYRTEDPEIYEALSNAVLKNDYTAMADVLRRAVEKLENEIVRRVAEGPKIQVLMTATLVDSEGRETVLHLDGYDAIATGTSTTFPRFRITLDERARRELAAAAALAPLVAAIKDPASGFQAALDDLKKIIQELPEQLNLEERITVLDSLATSLEDTGEENLKPLADRVRAIKKDLSVLSTMNLQGTTDLAAFASTIQSIVESVRKLRDEIPSRLETLRKDLKTTLGDRLEEIAPDADGALAGLLDSIAQNHEALKTFMDNVSSIASVVRATGGLTNAAEAASRKARELNVDTQLDTSLALKSIQGERHPGDYVEFDVQVQRTGEEGAAPATILSGGQSFRLEAYGLWQEVRGALLLVDPRSKISRDLSYQPVPGLGYFWHYGFKNKPSLNHHLSLGLGASLALLDFEDENDFELGIAVGATLLRDIFWVGYGRNLHAKANYFFVGVNPLTVAELFRR